MYINYFISSMRRNSFFLHQSFDPLLPPLVCRLYMFVCESSDPPLSLMHTGMQARKYIHTHMCVCAGAYIRIRTHSHKRTHAHTRTHMHTRARAHMRAHTQSLLPHAVRA